VPLYECVVNSCNVCYLCVVSYCCTTATGLAVKLGELTLEVVVLMVVVLGNYTGSSGSCGSSCNGSGVGCTE
jgi:hypothetical protein